MPNLYEKHNDLLILSAKAPIAIDRLFHPLHDDYSDPKEDEKIVETFSLEMRAYFMEFNGHWRGDQIDDFEVMQILGETHTTFGSEQSFDLSKDLVYELDNVENVAATKDVEGVERAIFFCSKFYTFFIRRAHGNFRAPVYTYRQRTPA